MNINKTEIAHTKINSSRSTSIKSIKD